MKHTGDGTSVSIRDLATATSVAPSTVGALLTGDQETLNIEAASAIADRIGVDLLVLWTPTGRSSTGATLREAVA
ncbi:helix-turn-helix domain-containing protein [Wenjunlia vitaminophila]|nr:helix-turn-helix transcriptional regulator [Wenjunlia vitaminophila]